MNKKTLVDHICEIGVATVIATAVIWWSSAAIGYPAENEAQEKCSYTYHDHYKNGIPNQYRIRHKHKICGTVAKHYQDDALTEQIYYVPEFYLEEDSEENEQNEEREP